MSRVVRRAAAALLLTATAASAQRPLEPAAAGAALPLRSIGPAQMGGRIQDVEVHPRDKSLWYVAAGSGGIWKTTNAGTTWSAIFENQTSYSIGEITLDPTNPEIIWVGTGENVSGRHVGWGDGVYRSADAGKSWKRMGLANSQHIGRILVDPRDGNVVLVAAEGPLWSAGGERGVYRTTDGGATWAPVLQIDENTGVTDLEFDPSDPNTVYAASYQRRRHVWGFLGGGPKSGLWKSTDNGKSWRQLRTGLPSGEMGKIGLAVTKADPSLVYATIEASGNDGGFYRSRDKGESWERRNPFISGGTGPHYYQELEASPHDANLVYQMDVFLRVTRDGGATFNYAETGHEKHSDNHALWIDPSDGRHMLVGTDAGLYESHDAAATWRLFPNLPISQFYKVALNDRLPFYDVLAGAQDLGTFHGPSRTMNREGVRNQDWYVPLGADGYGVAFDPKDPDLMYLMWQEGSLVRKDRRNEEGVFIRPQGAPGDPAERWNWDSPLLVSPHQDGRIYYGSQRLWRSDDQGSNWTPISGDLTLGQERYAQKFFGRVWSVDALHDNGAMSKYGTTTAITESPITAGVLAVGTDDGVVQVTTNGGAQWTRAAAPPGLPPLSFINDIEASVSDAKTIYLVADAHKIGDFTPYVYVSSDLGKSWRSIAGDLPKGTIVWSIQQDHVRPELLFVGTEFGIYWTPNAGVNWHKLAGGAPTIPFRDLKIHRRDGDLVGATFGRGIYVLDDYAPLRAIAAGALADEGGLFPVRDAWWYVPSQLSQAPGRPEAGSDDFTSPNPPFGALLSYHLRAVPQTAREARRAEEKTQREAGADSPFPGYDRLRAERTESAAKVLLTIADASGRTVRIIEGPATAGVHRVNWDLRGPNPSPVELNPPGFRPPWDDAPSGPLVAPGRYTATLALLAEGKVRTIGAPQSFEVKPVMNLAPATDVVAAAAFQARSAELVRRMGVLESTIGEVNTELRHIRATLVQAPKAPLTIAAQIDGVARKLAELQQGLYGDPARRGLDQSDAASVADRIWNTTSAWQTRQLPTGTQLNDAAIAERELTAIEGRLKQLLEGELAAVHQALRTAGAPWVPGARPE